MTPRAREAIDNLINTLEEEGAISVDEFVAPGDTQEGACVCNVPGALVVCSPNNPPTPPCPKLRLPPRPPGVD
ncbi:hypothetical protein VB735_34290 [Halotia wernerae UHCC 0503]|nr:hypothetical protein [Halotia wernerae UHCC 0503]